VVWKREPSLNWGGIWGVLVVWKDRGNVGEREGLVVCCCAVSEGEGRRKSAIKEEEEKHCVGEWFKAKNQPVAAFQFILIKLTTTRRRDSSYSSWDRKATTRTRTTVVASLLPLAQWAWLGRIWQSVRSVMYPQSAYSRHDSTPSTPARAARESTANANDNVDAGCFLACRPNAVREPL
jgi:hypothetical protein